MRKRLYEVIEAATEDDRLSNVYDIFMMIVIIASLIPLMFKEEFMLFFLIDKIALVVFVIDYILRWCMADFKVKRGRLSYVIYPFTPMAIMDLLCIMPSISLISNSIRILKIFRLFRTMRVLRVFKFIRYSKSLRMIAIVLTRQKRSLLTVLCIAIAYIMICAIIIFNLEPDSFGNYFDAIYWATVSLTTMGYGDITPVTTVGRLMTIVSSLFGIAIIAMPSAIITAGFMEMLYNTYNTDISDDVPECNSIDKDDIRDANMNKDK